MSIYNKNLYKNIIQSEGSEASTIRVLSGYASANFVEKVLSELPSIKLELYIGMSQQGIVESDHLKFKQIVNSHPKVSVYYQYRGPLNHMKVIEFTFSDLKGKKVYLGSANFTENGYCNNLEIMASVNMDIDYLIENQHGNSLSCLSDDISNYIPFLLENEMANNQSLLTETDLIEESNGVCHTINQPKLNKVSIDELISLFIGSNQYKYDELILDIVLPKHKNIHWDTRGINAYFEGRKPVIEATSGVDFEGFFPKHNFFIRTSDNEVYEATLTGKFNKQLTFEGLDIYCYIKGKLGLEEDKAISYEMLSKHEMEKVHFIKGADDDYLMLFHKENL